MLKTNLLAFSAALLGAANIAAAAGAFDGKWQVQTEAGRCSGAAARGEFSIIFVATVTGNDLTGTISGGRGTVEGKTTIAPDGSFTLTVALTTISGKFAGDKLAITAKSSICVDRSGTGGRVS
jgi:hypothetical protein